MGRAGGGEKVKRTLKRGSKVLEIVKREPNERSVIKKFFFFLYRKKKK